MRGKNYVILCNGYQNPIIEKLDTELTLITPEMILENKITLNNNDKLYFCSDECLQSLSEHLNHLNNIKLATVFANKYNFRKCLKSMYPEFYFTHCNVEDLPKFNLNFSQCNKYIVKPEQGFFSVAVKTIEKDSDLSEVTSEIKEDLENNRQYFSNSVSEDLIIEEFIGSHNKTNDKGLNEEEIAIDLYYDDTGTPTILNIYHHPRSSNNAYFHTLYYTSYDTFFEIHPKAIDFFTELGQKLTIKNMPLHAEFKLNDNKLFPIEINPYRFGGYGLANLCYYAFKINPFLAYFRNEKPNWQKIWQVNREKYFAWIGGYKGVNMNCENQMPNHTKLKKFLGNILAYQTLNHQQHPLFAVAYICKKNKKDILDLCNIEFDEFIMESVDKASGESTI